LEKIGDAFFVFPGTSLLWSRLLVQLGTQKREVGMRRVLLTTVALIASATVTAVAADLPRAMPAKAPAFVPVGYNWTGFYVGINGGYAWGSSRWNSFAVNADPSGGMVG
jgi:hypothetical protein